jgi:hypothetical protein
LEHCSSAFDSKHDKIGAETMINNHHLINRNIDAYLNISALVKIHIVLIP